MEETRLHTIFALDEHCKSDRCALFCLGADITDYFNYGFTEETWAQYSDRQRRLRSENNTARLNAMHVKFNRHTFVLFLLCVGNFIQIPQMPQMLPVHPPMVHPMNPHPAMIMNKPPMNVPIMPRPFMNVRKQDGKIDVIGMSSSALFFKVILNIFYSN